MTRVHLIRWVCGKAVYFWQWMSETQADKIQHLTPAMVHHREAIAAIKLTVLECVPIVGLISPAIHYAPEIVRLVAYRPEGYRRMTEVPEPGSLIVFGVAVIGLAVVRRSR